MVICRRWCIKTGNANQNRIRKHILRVQNVVDHYQCIMILVVNARSVRQRNKLLMCKFFIKLGEGGIGNIVNLLRA